VVEVLNDFSCKTHRNYQYFSEVNDDHVFVTEGWDLLMMHAIDARNNGVSIAYGKTQLYPTATMHGAKLVHGLGYFFPPEYQHTLVDFWLMKIGWGSGILTYVPEVLIDHLHPAFNTAPWDPVYEAGTHEPIDAERHYHKWVQSKLNEDILLVMNIIGSHRNLACKDIPDLSNDPVTVAMISESVSDDLFRKTVNNCMSSGRRPSRIFIFGGDVKVAFRIPEAIYIKDCTDREEAIKHLEKAGAKNITVVSHSCLFKKGWWKLLQEGSPAGKKHPTLFQSLMPGAPKAEDFDPRSLEEIIKEDSNKEAMLREYPLDFGPQHPLWKVPSKRNKWFMLQGLDRNGAREDV
jgi:predicted RNA binding protein YcfA (HicA-like mRNA interferase family)